MARTLQPNLDDVPPETAYAYARIFTAEPDLGVRVLRDLAEQTGFLATLPRGADAGLLVDHNARRAVFGRVYEILSLTEGGREITARAFRPATQQKDDT